MNVDPFERNAISVVGTMTATRFEPAADVSVREMCGRGAQVGSCLLPHDPVLPIVDNFVRIPVHNQHRTLGGGKRKEFDPIARHPHALIRNPRAELAVDVR